MLPNQEPPMSVGKGQESPSAAYSQEPKGTRNTQNPAHFLTNWLSNKKATGGSWK